MGLEAKLQTSVATLWHQKMFGRRYVCVHACEPWSIIRYALSLTLVACMACRSFVARQPFDRCELETFPRFELTRCNG